MLLDAYREVYYQGGVSSVYLWDQEEGSGSTPGSFAGCFLILKRVGGGGGEGPVGSWESSHVVQVCFAKGPCVDANLNRGQLGEECRCVRSINRVRNHWCPHVDDVLFLFIVTMSTPPLPWDKILGRERSTHLSPAPYTPCVVISRIGS